MDDAMKRMEERLEALVPKGLSDLGRERLEETIDELAAGTTVSGSGTWKWAVGSAACLGLAAGLALLAGPKSTPMAQMPVVAPDEVALASYEPAVETVLSSLHVEGRYDEGLVMDGVNAPHRYWAYELTNEEEVVDEETGFTVRIMTQREEWVPVKMTSL